MSLTWCEHWSSDSGSWAVEGGEDGDSLLAVVLVVV